MWQKGEILRDRRLTGKPSEDRKPAVARREWRKRDRPGPESDQQVLTAVWDRVREVNKNSSEEMAAIVIVIVSVSQAQLRTHVAR